MVKSLAIGIDLGTSSSRVGVWQENHVEIIPNDLGKRKTSSYVSFIDSECLVGDRAFYQVGKNYKNTVFDIKRLVGHGFNDLNINSNKKYWPFKVVEKDEKVFISIESKNEAKNITPIELYSMMLVNMKETAENYLEQEISDAVITVPACFNNTQRMATREAAAIAGLNVLQIINEPTAAALAYGFNKNINDEENVLIVDLGGGTFDVTLFTINNHTYKVKATGGDTHLGGEDFTNRLIDHFIKEFKEKHNIDPSTNLKSLRRLRIECEKIKISLTSFAKAQIDIDYFYDDIDFSSSITRSCFEEISSDLFEKIEKTIKMVIDDSGLDKSEINEIVLVGGSTRIPKIRNIISAFFDNKEINKTIDVDEAVTCGAAIQAFILSGEKEIPKQIKDITISDVVSHSISICCINDEKKIIERNSSIPIPKKNIEWTVPNNQDSVSFKIYEGENQLLKDNYLLDEFIINQMSSLSSTIKINISFNIDINGILNFSIDDYYRHKKIISINNKNKMLNSNEIEHIKENAKANIKNKENENERIEYMNRLDEYAYKLKTYIENEKNIYVIPPDDIKKINDNITDTIEWIKDNQNARKEDYEKKEIELRNIHNHLQKLCAHYHKLYEKDYEKREKKRIEQINYLEKYAYKLKMFIENEKNIYGIPPDDIKKINDYITDTIEWIKGNQNARKEDYEKKEIELRDIHNHLQKLYAHYHKLYEKDYEKREKKRIEYMNYLQKYAYDIKAYIENEKNIYVIPPDDIKKINDYITDTIEWIKDNQNARKEDYEKKEIELRDIHNHLQKLYAHYHKLYEKDYEKREKKRIKQMNYLQKYAYDIKAYIENEKNIYGIPPIVIEYANHCITDTFEWIEYNYNKDISKDDYKKKETILKDCLTDIIEWREDTKDVSNKEKKKRKNKFKGKIVYLQEHYIETFFSFFNFNNHKDYERKEKEIMMNDLVEGTYKLKMYIENEKNIYRIPPADIKNLTDNITNIITWMKNNKNASKKNYEYHLNMLEELKIQFSKMCIKNNLILLYQTES